MNLDTIIYLILRNKHGHKLTDKKIRLISDSLGIDFDQLQMINESYSGVWFTKDVTRMEIICLTYPGISKPHFFSGYLNLTKEVSDKILSMKPTEVFNNLKVVKPVGEPVMEPVVKPVMKVKEVLEMDAILDKINEMGIGSLTVNEFEYLKSLSN